MNKKIYNMPRMRIYHVITEDSVAQFVVSSQEHEDQWSKERGADFDDYEAEGSSEQGYGSLW